MLGGIALADTTPPAPGGGGSSGPVPAMAGPHGMRGHWGVAGTAQGPVSGGSFTLAARGQTYTVAVDASTTYSYGPGLSASAGAVNSGVHVMVQGTVSGTDVTATAVHIQIPGERGQVVSVSGSQVTVQAPDGRQAVIDISGISSAPSVAPYEEVAAAGTWNSADTSGVADTLDAQAFAVVPARLGGTLSAVGGTPGSSGTATVQTRSGQSVTLSWSATTTFKTFTPGRGPGAGAGSTSTSTSTSTPVTLSTGQVVVARGQWNGPAGASGSTFTATQITVLPAPAPGQSGGWFGPGRWSHGGHGNAPQTPGGPPPAPGSGS